MRPKLDMSAGPDTVAHFHVLAFLDEKLLSNRANKMVQLNGSVLRNHTVLKLAYDPYPDTRQAWHSETTHRPPVLLAMHSHSTALDTRHAYTHYTYNSLDEIMT